MWCGNPRSPPHINGWRFLPDVICDRRALARLVLVALVAHSDGLGKLRIFAIIRWRCFVSWERVIAVFWRLRVWETILHRCNSVGSIFDRLQDACCDR